jgi:hypothetical protein
MYELVLGLTLKPLSGERDFVMFREGNRYGPSDEEEDREDRQYNIFDQEREGARDVFKSKNCASYKQYLSHFY